MRTTTSLNTVWIFTDSAGNHIPIDIPHTWNAKDGQDGGNNYYRGSCIYRKNFSLPVFEAARQRVYIEFCGVNATADVELNGQKVIHHDCGYSTFRADITDLLSAHNELVVTVNNGVNRNVYPQKADFTFYGGIYRDVNLLIVSKDHFDLDYYGSNGIKVTPTVNEGAASVCVETFVKGETGDVHITLTDADGGIVAQGVGNDITLTIPDVHLWNGIKDPYLYTATAQLISDNTVLDEVSARFGVRTFHVDPQKGFYLNGKSYPLRGVSRHQDRDGIGNALRREHHNEDMQLIREVGANTIRLAHYQHDQYFYNLCDEFGFVVWAEIPYISEHMPEGRENTIEQMKELIAQNYNHPSIVTWGISNEITISTKKKKDMLDNHDVLNDLCHKMDRTRPTTLACYSVCMMTNPSVHISDIVGYNLYLGWYVPGFKLNDWFIKFFHWKYPKRCLGYAEYGAEGMPNLHSSKPRRGDHTEEYQAIYHEYMLKCFERYPYLWSTYVWNMFDFAADARDQGGEPGMNHKGLITFDRKIKKDSFYLYKAYWSETPFVHLCGKRYQDRTEKETTVKVYSNQAKVTLYNNGQLIEEQTGSRVFTFRVQLEDENRLEVIAGEYRDTSVIYKTEKPNPAYKLKKGKSRNWV